MAFGEDLDALVERTSGLLGKHESWERVRLAQVADVVNGFAFKSKFFSKDQGKPLVRIRDVLSGETETLYDGPEIEGYDVKLGDLLIGMDGDFNSARWKGRDALLNQRVCRVDFKTELYNSRLISFVLPGYLNKINEHTSAVTVKHLSSKTIKNIPLPLPPLAEQGRIVDKIEELFSSIEAGERAIERARAALSRYRKSILKAAVTGELTRDWREQNPPSETAEALLERILKARNAAWEKAELDKLTSKSKPQPQTDKQWEKFRARYKEPVAPDTEGLPSLPDNWLNGSFDLIGDVSGGLTKNKARREIKTKRPFLRVANVYANRLELDEIHEIGVKDSELNRVELKNGDILIVEGNGSESQIGRAAVWRNNIEGCVHQNHLIKVRVHLGNPDYFMIWLTSLYGRDEIKKVASSTSGLFTLSISKVMGVGVPMPPLTEQTEIVSRVEEALSKADAVEATLEAQAQSARALKQAVLKTAFEGRLVPQDPNDEPASELLKRIKAVW